MGMNCRRTGKEILYILIVGCIFMGFVDAVWQPGYAVKSLLKIMVFLAIPLAYGCANKQIKLKSLFVVRTRGMLRALFLGVAVYAFIMACYFTIGTFFDFSQVTGALNETVGVRKDNFIFVAIYISFINSLLEEFFFRGFAFLNLKGLTNRGFAYVVSSLSFAFYHVAMMIGWFSIWLFLLLLAGLFLAGLLFDWLNEKRENIYTSWFVHMFANFAINSVGFMLFGMI